MGKKSAFAPHHELKKKGLPRSLGAVPAHWALFERIVWGHLGVYLK